MDRQLFGKTIVILDTIKIEVERYGIDDKEPKNSQELYGQLPFEARDMLSEVGAIGAGKRDVSDGWGRGVVLVRKNDRLGAIGSSGPDGIWQDGDGDDIIVLLNETGLNEVGARKDLCLGPSWKPRVLIGVTLAFVGILLALAAAITWLGYRLYILMFRRKGIICAPSKIPLKPA